MCFESTSGPHVTADGMRFSHILISLPFSFGPSRFGLMRRRPRPKCRQKSIAVTRHLLEGRKRFLERCALLSARWTGNDAARHFHRGRHRTFGSAASRDAPATFACRRQRRRVGNGQENAGIAAGWIASGRTCRASVWTARLYLYLVDWIERTY